MHGSIPWSSLIADNTALPIACQNTYRTERAYRRQALFLKTSAGGKEITNRSDAQGCFTA
ncbi:MAG: hypothetical protein A4E72_00022 [Syntrophus sp. PtaU1.Bin208]|nr:MAG: hypothetical protein A4E72_00022 [Syntrophus sp. PtaU1.Bin208]